MGMTSNHTCNRRNTGTHSKAKYMADLSKGLPYGWRVEIKTRKTGTRVGQEYKCYISPVTGCKFYSMGQVSRYLKSRPKVERNVLTQLESHVVIERKDSVDGLPPGWTVKLKVTRKGDRIRTDPYYTDPMTGYVFRSRKDVLRYLKTGELGNYAFKPKEGDFQDVEQMDEKTSPSSTAKKQKHFPTCQSTKCNEAVNNEHALESSTTGGISPSGCTSDQCEENTELSSLTSLEAESSKRKKGKKVAAKKVLLSLPAMTVPSSEKRLLVNGAEEHERKTPLESKKRKDRTEVEIPRRVSKRLAEINSKLAANVEIPSATCQAASMQPPEPKLAVNSTSGSRSHSVPELSNQLESEKAGNFISFATTSKEPIKQEGCHVGTQEQINTAHGNRGEDPHKQGLFCIGTEEQATRLKMPEQVYNQATHGTIEIETKADQKLESTLQLPFGGSWPDPSLEFAFKTLTGGEIVEFSSIASLESKSSTRRNGKKVATRNVFLSVPPTTVPSSEKQLLENGLEEHERKTLLVSRKRKVRKELNIPRRVSKRLAEVNAKLASDIESPSSTCRAATMQSPEAKLSVNSTSGSRSRSVSEQPNQPESEKEGNSMFYATMGEEPFKQEGCHGSRGLFCIGREEQATELRTPRPICDQAPLGEFEVEMKADQKLESTLQFPFGDSWHQSLEFAFKTLTGGEITELVTLASLETESSKRRKEKKIASKKVLLSAPPTTVPSSEKLLLENRLEEHETETRRGSRKGRKEKELDIPRRVSKRLAEVKAKLALDKESPSSEQPNQLQFEKAGFSMSHATTGEEPLKQERYHVETKEQTNTADSSRGEKHLKQGVFCVGREEETTKLEMPLAVCNQAALANVEFKTNSDQLESTVQFPFGGSWPDPSLEFAFKTLTGAIPVEDCFAVQDCFQHQVSSNLQLPFGVSWPDPSLEFAFKTLTGAIPLEDSLSVPDCFQHRQNSTQSQNNRLELPGFSINDFCQTDNFFQFDSIVKPGTPNQLHKLKAPVSTSASVVACSNSVVQRRDENVECKRMDVNP